MKEIVRVNYIKELDVEGEVPVRIDELSKLIDSNPSCDLFMERADLFKKIHALGKAMNDYRCALKLSPDDKTIITKINILENILSIENTFYYENAYTDDILFPEI